MRSLIIAVNDRLKGKHVKGHKRSSKWPKVRKAHLKEFPECAVCKSKKNVEVHHCVPFHVDPSLELEPSNLLTLCEHGRFKSIDCHLAIGHLCNYKNYNPKVKDDAQTFKMKIEQGYERKKREKEMSEAQDKLYLQLEQIWLKIKQDDGKPVMFETPRGLRVTLFAPQKENELPPVKGTEDVESK